jgi:hypothetical protein
MREAHNAVYESTWVNKVLDQNDKTEPRKQGLILYVHTEGFHQPLFSFDIVFEYWENFTEFCFYMDVYIAFTYL